MVNTYLDILDTAVKIGLGALISGVTTYYITTAKLTNENNKEFRNRKLNIIESAVTHADEYINAFRAFLAAIDGVKARHPDTIILDLANDKDKSAWDFIKKNDDMYIESRKHMSSASSKLNIIGLTEAAAILDKLIDIDTAVRDMIIFNFQLPTNQELIEWQKEVKVFSDNLYIKLNLHYKV